MNAQNWGKWETAEYVPDEELEIRLKKLSRKIVLLNIVIGALFITADAGFIFATVNIRFSAGLLIALPALAACLVAVLFRILSKIEIKNLMGDNIIRRILEEEFELSQYAPAGAVDTGQIKAADLFFDWDAEDGSDLVQGKYRGVDFAFSDIRLSPKTKKNRGRKSSKTIFRGQWVVCELRKTLPARLILRERRTDGKGMKSDVETENTAFNRKYQISSDDPHMAFYILTPHFMEYILNMDEQADARTYLSFIGSAVHIALHNDRDLFELNTKKGFGGVSVTKLREQVRADVKYIKGVLDELLLNEYLFNKEE